MAKIIYTNGKTENYPPETIVDYEPPNNIKVNDEMLKTLMSIADTLLTISQTLEEVRYSITELRNNQ